MLRDLKFFAYCVSFATAVALTGCGDSGAKKGMGNAPAHGDKDHDHGNDGHAHAEEGPHHGHLIELGEEAYHLELAHNESTKTITVYVLDSQAKGAVPIDDKELMINLVTDAKPAQFKLAAAPQSGDPAGKASAFQLTDAKLCDALDAESTTGRIALTIAGTPYTGKFSHEAHGEHEHK